jgi:carboxymethylenebutenolidase
MTAGRDILIKSESGHSFSGYLSAPPSGRGPGLLVFHAIFGVNKVVRDVADGYAAKGYVVLCPDLFWRQEPGVQLSEQREEDWARGMALFAGFDAEAALYDLTSSLSALRSLPECDGRAACVGYCFGGRMAYFMAARNDVSAAVSYYGTAIEKHLDLAPEISRPLMLHLAEKDRFVPEPAQDSIKAAVEGHAGVVVHTYAGVDHAFARVGAPSYDKASAELANRRTDDFLRKHLG